MLTANIYGQFDFVQRIAYFLPVIIFDVLLQFFKSLNITADLKKIFKKSLHSYYDAVQELLRSEHAVRVSCPIADAIIFIFLFLRVLLLEEIRSC